MPEVKFHDVTEEQHTEHFEELGDGLREVTIPKLITLNGKRVKATQKVTMTDELSVREECICAGIISREDAHNVVWVETVDAMCRIRSIDGDPVKMPTTEREVWALVQRLTDIGVQELRLMKMMRMQAAMDEIKARAKN